MDRWTIATLLETVTGYLRDKGSSSPRLDAELLLAETLGLERIHLYTEYDRPLSSCELERYRHLIGRRGQHEPVAYILGKAYFRHLRLETSPAVLIPRPETEELVDAVLGSLLLRPLWEDLADSPPETATVVDVGTGSGAIALSLAQEAGVRVLALDVSAEALEVAARNRSALGLESLVELRRADLLEGLPDKSLRMVVSNPPYVTTGDMGSLAPDVRLFEPSQALEGGADGLDVVRRLLPQAARTLMPGGSVILELGTGQADSASALARDAGFVLPAVKKDLSGKPRILTATLPGAPRLPLSGLSTAQSAALGAAMEAGAVIGLPTDTVYGLAARWDSSGGMGRLVAAKGRDDDRPVAVLFSSVEAVRQALPDLDGRAARVLAALLPGPFTFVVATAVERPRLVGTADSLGVRVPDHPDLLAFLEALGVPLAATSANRSGEPDPLTLDMVTPEVLAHCSLTIFAVAATPAQRASEPSVEEAARSPRGVGPASTVVDLRPLGHGGAPAVLREGTVSSADALAQIAAVLGDLAP